MAYLTLLYLQTNAEYRRCVNYPSDKALEMASSQMDVLRHNHRQMEKQHGVAMYKKESCIDVREDIAMVKKYLLDKLGKTYAECRRAGTYSRMTETDLNADEVGWAVMLSKEQDLRDWVDKQIRTNGFRANGPVPDDLAAELGLAQAAMDPQVDVEDGDGGEAMGAVEAEVEVMADDQPDVPMDIPMEENEGPAGGGSSSGALPLVVFPEPEAQAGGESSSEEEVVRGSTGTRSRPARPLIIMPPMEECFIDLEEIPTPILALPPPPTGAPEPPVDEGSSSSEEGEFLDHRARRNTGATSNMNEAPTQVSCLI